MLMPKKIKFRKQQRGRRRGMAKGGDYIAFGDHGLQAVEAGWITARQIEAARIAIARSVKGKGNPEEWVAVVRPGRVLFELEGVETDLAREAMKMAGYKFGIKTRYIARRGELA
jgi:large subunit ribosomal protein L16